MRFPRVLVAVIVASGFCFQPLSAQDLTDEKAIWEVISKSSRAEDLKLYLEVFPDGQFAVEARTRLNAIRQLREKVKELSRVDQLLQTCQTHFDANRLTSGVGGNALDCYHEVLAISPGNPSAVEGINAIISQYAVWARAALAKQQVENANRHIEQIRFIDEDSPIITELVHLRDWATDAAGNMASASTEPIETTKVVKTYTITFKTFPYDTYVGIYDSFAAKVPIKVIKHGGSVELEAGRYFVDIESTEYESVARMRIKVDADNVVHRIRVYTGHQW